MIKKKDFERENFQNKISKTVLIQNNDFEVLERNNNFSLTVHENSQSINFKSKKEFKNEEKCHLCSINFKTLDFKNYWFLLFLLF